MAGNSLAKARWLSKLYKTKIRGVGLLEKRAAKDPQTQHLQNAFDDLLPSTGLWPALREHMDLGAPDIQESVQSAEDYLNALLLNLDIV